MFTSGKMGKNVSFQVNQSFYKFSYQLELWLDLRLLHIANLLLFMFFACKIIRVLHGLQSFF